MTTHCRTDSAPSIRVYVFAIIELEGELPLPSLALLHVCSESVTDACATNKHISCQLQNAGQSTKTVGKTYSFPFSNCWLLSEQSGQSARANGVEEIAPRVAKTANFMTDDAREPWSDVLGLSSCLEGWCTPGNRRG